MRIFIQVIIAACSLTALSTSLADEPMELKIDHVMFPVYANNAFLDTVEADWKERKTGKVFTQPQNDFFKAVYLRSKSFYVEYLSNVETQPYWSNTVFIVVPTEYWAAYENPVMKSEYFLIPSFGSGYQLVSPDYPHLNEKNAGDEDYDGMTILISTSLAQELLTIGGENWTLPKNGKVQVHEGLVHFHDIVVIDEQSKLVAQIYEANPILRDFF